MYVDLPSNGQSAIGMKFMYGGGAWSYAISYCLTSSSQGKIFTKFCNAFSWYLPVSQAKRIYWNIFQIEYQTHDYADEAMNHHGRFPPFIPFEWNEDPRIK